MATPKAKASPAPKPSTIAPTQALELIKAKKLTKLHLCTAAFTWLELMPKQTEVPSLSVLTNLLSVASVLTLYKAKLFNNAAITITSGWRSQAYNDNLSKQKKGVASKSYHIVGMALDFTVKGFTTKQVFDLMNKVHFGGVEKTDGNWQHIDVRGKISRFDVNSKPVTSTYTALDHNKVFGVAH